LENLLRRPRAAQPDRDDGIPEGGQLMALEFCVGAAECAQHPPWRELQRVHHPTPSSIRQYRDSQNLISAR
jgi:hypothetical protein